MKDKSRINNTANNFNSLAWTICVCLAVCFVADAVLAITLMCIGVDFAYVVFPLLAAIADVVFFVIALNSNFRFRYALVFFLLYVVLYAVFCLCSVAVSTSGATVAMERWIAAAFSVFHVVCICVVCGTYVYSARRHRNNGAKPFVAVCVALCLLIATVTAYGVLFFKKGFFGQGFEGVVRPVEYAYNEADDSYSVSGVLDGKGDTVIIKPSFNGKPVKYVSCQAFSADGIKNVKFTGAVNYNLVNAYALYRVGSDVKVFAEKEIIDDVKQLFYTAFDDTLAEAAFSFVNCIQPSNLDKDEVCLTFSYTTESYKIFNGKIIPTWIGRKGDTFRSEVYDNYEVFQHSNVHSDSDLEWSFYNCDGYVFDGLKVDGVELNGTAVTQSHNVPIVFEKIYRVYVGEDNDTLYETADSYKKSTVNGIQKDFKYIVPSIADEFIGALPKRDGFDAYWMYKAEASSVKQYFTSLRQLLENEGRENVYVYPHWRMVAPNVSAFTKDYNNEIRLNNTFTYGEKVVFTSEASPANPSFNLSYQWIKGNDVSQKMGKESFEFSSVEYDAGGVYNLIVTSTSDVSSLSESTIAAVNLTVKKRKVTVEWDSVEIQNNQYKYTGTAQTVGVSISSDSIINDDSVSWSLYTTSQSGVSVNTEHTGIEFRDAGKYDVSLQLNGNDSYKYEIGVGGIYSVNIDKCAVTVDWGVYGNGSGVYSRQYNGQTLQPIAQTLTGVGEDGTLGLSYNYYTNNYESVSSPKDVGEYHASALLSGQYSRNYTLINANCPYAITPAEITVHWSDASNLVYNGEKQTPTVNSVDNVVANEIAYLRTRGIRYSVTTNDPIASGYVGVYAGQYTVTATLVNYNSYLFKNNYVISKSSRSLNFEINKATAEVNWEAAYPSYPYDAQIHKPTATVAGVGSDGNLNISITTNKQAIDVGSDYVATATLASNDVNNNYTLSSSTTPFRITVISIPINWTNTTLTYNGKAQTPTPSGVYERDKASISVTVTAKTGSSLTSGNSVNVGQYVAEVTTNANYNVVNGKRQEFEIIQKALTVTVKLSRGSFTDNRPAISAIGASCQIVGLVNGHTHSTTYSYVSNVEGSSGYLEVTATVRIYANSIEVTNNYAITVVTAKLDKLTSLSANNLKQTAVAMRLKEAENVL